jgi:hypothetical protein
MKKLMNATVALGLLLVSSSAAAAVCVEVDEERDNLAPAERQATKTMVEQALEGEDLNVARDNCTTTYTIYSLRLGNSVTANISGPEGSRTQKASSLDELPETYNQITRALISGEEGQNAGVDRHNVTKKQSAPRRVLADNIYYLRLGYGLVAGGDIGNGPAFGFGWRYELDQFGIDISGFNFMFDNTDADDGLNWSLLRLGGLYFFDPVNNSTPYAGAALSYGWTGLSEEVSTNDYKFYSGNGLQGELTAGYEFLRASTIRMFVEANAVLPFYTADRTFNDDEDSKYAPTFTVSIGLGYDPDPNPVIEVYD